MPQVNNENRGTIDLLRNLKIQKFRHGSHFAAIAPTWLISEKVTLEDFIEDFLDPTKEADALRDFACIPSASLRPYFKDPSIIYANADPRRVKPINSSLNIEPWFHPLSGVFYFLACDLSVSRDSCGVAMVHRDFGIMDTVNAGFDRYVVDFSIQIKASKATPVDFEAIRQLIRALKRRGFRFSQLGFDQFQSHDSFLILSNEGFDVEIVKYHDSLAGCGLVWDLIHTRNLVYGLCDDVLIGEASELQVVNSKRIDHLESGGIYNSKDVWDSVVNACVLASKQKTPFTREFLQT